MSKFCSNCGTEIKKGASFCSNCGKELKEATSVSQEETQTEYVQKSRLAGGLLGVFLGSLGVHNFYLGYTGKAVAQLLITVLSCWFLFPVSGIWGLIEGILILTGSINVDAEGRKLID